MLSDFVMKINTGSSQSSMTLFIALVPCDWMWARQCQNLFSFRENRITLKDQTLISFRYMRNAPDSGFYEFVRFMPKGYNPCQQRYFGIVCCNESTVNRMVIVRDNCLNMASIRQNVENQEQDSAKNIRARTWAHDQPLKCNSFDFPIPGHLMQSFSLLKVKLNLNKNCISCEERNDLCSGCPRPEQNG